MEFHEVSKYTHYFKILLKHYNAKLVGCPIP